MRSEWRENLRVNARFYGDTWHDGIIRRIYYKRGSTEIEKVDVQWDGECSQTTVQVEDLRLHPSNAESASAYVRPVVQTPAQPQQYAPPPQPQVPMDFEAMCEACPHHERRHWDRGVFWWYCTACKCWSAESHIVSQKHLKKCSTSTPLMAWQHPQCMAWMESPEPREVSPSTGKDMAPPPPGEPPPEPSPAQPPPPPPRRRWFRSPCQVPGALETQWAAQEVEETGSDETIVGFGRHADKMYKEVPEKYLKWVMEVLREDPECQGKLARLAAWAKSQISPDKATEDAESGQTSNADQLEGKIEQMMAGIQQLQNRMTDIERKQPKEADKTIL